MKVLLFFILLVLNIFIVLYYIYSYIELFFFNSKQGETLRIKEKEH
jgi:hypothetical protein